MDLSVHQLLAQVVGPIGNPLPSGASYQTGIVQLLNNILRLIFVAAGIYALLNLIVAGFGFMTAGGDSKAISKAWDRIWQTFVGLIIIVGSFALAALIGQIFFGSATFILSPTITGPGM